MSDPHTDHDTVVVNDGGSSTGLILGIIAVIIVLAGALVFPRRPRREHEFHADRRQRGRHAPERRARRLLGPLRVRPARPQARRT